MKNAKLFLLIPIISFSCKNTLNEKDRSWNPYKDSDVLVFESNNGARDTIQIDNIKRYMSNENEIESVNSTMNGRKTFLMALTAWENEKTVLSINLITANAILYNFSAKRLTWLDSLPQNRLTASGSTFNDVLILVPDNDSAQKSNEKALVEKLYWSKSNGLIGYDLADGTSWTLNKKYSL